MALSDFEKEVQEQSRALVDTFQYYRDPKRGSPLLDCLKGLDLDQVDSIMFTGMGSSYFCAYISYYLLNSNNMRCNLYDTGELLNFIPKPSNHKSERINLLFGVSQSGESGELVELIKKWDLKNNIEGNSSKFYGISNTINSTLGKSAELLFPTIAGYETSVTSKTYTTSLLVQYLISSHLLKFSWDKISDEIEQVINIVEQDLEPTPSGESNFSYLGNRIFEFFGDSNFMVFLAQGSSLSTAHQSCLNFKEMIKRPAEALTSNMFRHGPIESTNPNFHAIIFNSSPETFETSLKLCENITQKWGKGKAVLFTNQDFIPKEQDSNPNMILIPNPVTNPYLAPIYEIIVLQYYFIRFCKEIGLIPGEFYYSQKVTK